MKDFTYILRITLFWVQYDREFKAYGFGLLEIEREHRALLAVFYNQDGLEIDFLYFHILKVK